MDLGASLSMSWLGDLSACRDAVVALDRAGFDHVEIGGHLLTVREGQHPQLPPVMYAATYRDPFVFFGSLATETEHIRFRTSVLILPMMPTVLVAKQAAELAILSGGRLDLGVGISWQEVEYRAMGQSLEHRGRRLEEQVTVLRRLWTEPFVSFSGEFHDLDAIGLGQLPPRIPIWFGCGTGDAALARAGRLADGWLPLPGAIEEGVPRLRAHAQRAGRDPETIAVAPFVGADETVIDQAQEQIVAGATALTLYAQQDLGPAEGLAAILAAGRSLRAAAL